MKNLISMTDFVISQWDKYITREDFAQSMIRYATFLLQPLELWMFIPCKLVDGVWVVLEIVETGTDLKYHPLNPSKEVIEYFKDWEFRQKEYNQAKERLLFNGCSVRKTNGWKLYLQNKKYCINFISFNNKVSGYVIQDLVNYNLELTQTAIKLI